MLRILLMITLFMSWSCLAQAAPAGAAMTYPPDPVFTPLNPEAPEPMDSISALAREGDVRAQFILGDLYAKGKGGLKKSAKKSQQWFEASGRNGYAPAFVRLAAMAKKKERYIEAYKWYTLAVETGRGDWRRYARTARDEMTKTQEMSTQDINLARNNVRLWHDKKRAHEDADRIEAAREKARNRQKPVRKKEQKETTLNVED